jgi:hypothetical protein
VSPSGQALNVAFDQERNVYVLQEDLEVKATKQVQLDVGPIKTRVIDYPGSNGGYGLIRRGTEFTPSEMAYLEDGLRHPVQYASEGAPKDPAHRYDLFRVRITDGPVRGRPTPTFLEKIEFPERPDGAAVRRLDAGVKLPVGPGHGVEAGYVWKFALREGATAPENASRVVTLGSDLSRVDDTVLDGARSRRPGDVTMVNVLPSAAQAPDGASTVTGFALDNAMAPAVTGTSGSWVRESHDAVMGFLNGLDEASNPAVSRAYAVFGRSPATGRITPEQSEILKAVLRGEVAKAETRPAPRAAGGE